jgi:beta-glucosidase
VLITVALSFALLTGNSSVQTPPYKNPKLPVDVRVKDLLGRMTTAEKIAQLRSDSDPAVLQAALPNTGFGFNIVYRDRASTPADAAKHINESQDMAMKSRLGIPVLPWEEALHGLLLNGHTSMPQSIGMAATWDPELVNKAAEAVAQETRAEGVRQVLSPVINVVRDARWGRVEETYGEDPLLTARMAVAFVTAFEKNGVVTTPKHFVANLWDGGRDSNSVHISERQLRDIYMEPFRAVFEEGGARSVMCSYNAVNGIPCADDPWLLTDVLRKEWGFKGYVISDYGAASNILDDYHQAPTADGAAALMINAGMEVEAPSIYLSGKPLEDAVAKGLISTKALDTAVGRVLHVKFEIGLFDQPMVDPDMAASLANSAAHKAIALEAARKTMVLLKNGGDVLPLKGVGKIAVFGDLANDMVPLGGYSGEPGPRDSILQGLKKARPSVDFNFVPGCSINPNASLPAIPASVTGGGLKGEYWSNQTFEGAPVVTRMDATVDFSWGDASFADRQPTDHFSARWTGTLTAPETGEYAILITSDDGSRVWVDGKLVANNWSDHGPASVVGQVTLEAGKPVPIKVEFYESGGGAVMKLGWQKISADDALLADVRSAASAADVSVVFVGILEGEGQDRSYLKLPGNQEAVIKAAAASGKPVVVVLVAGAPVTMEGWEDKVPAILDAWYPGEEGAKAIAETLFGDNNPGGKLPMTFPKTVGQCPLYYNYEPSGRGYGYVDNTGDPLFAFGHGLSYTKFVYSGLTITPVASGQFLVMVNVKNTGSVAGDEVVQLYLHQQVSDVIRPFKELEGFERISLAPGETRNVAFAVGFKELSMYNRAMQRVVEPGKFDVMIGSSSADIRQVGVLNVPN